MCEEIHTQLAARPDVLVLDLSEVDFFGSSGANVLIAAQAEAGEHDTKLTVVVPIAAWWTGCSRWRV